jgi:hypothetical protein
MEKTFTCSCYTRFFFSSGSSSSTSSVLLFPFERFSLVTRMRLGEVDVTMGLSFAIIFFDFLFAFLLAFLLFRAAFLISVLLSSYREKQFKPLKLVFQHKIPLPDYWHPAWQTLKDDLAARKC